MSTGPSGGSGGTTGPGHFLRGFMDHMRAGRARADKAAREAGARATSPSPLTAERRETNYIRQNSTGVSGGLTARQRRRIEHKSNRAAVKVAG